MYTAYYFRIYPTDKQKELFVKTFGCARSIYNKMLADKIEHYKQTRKMLKPYVETTLLSIKILTFIQY